MSLFLPKNLLVASVAAASIALPAGAFAQALEEVVVTATKRAVGMQDVPIALSVMSMNVFSDIDFLAKGASVKSTG